MFLKNRSFFKRALCDGTKTRCFLTNISYNRFFIVQLASLGVSEIGDSHQMIIEIIKEKGYTVTVTNDGGTTVNEHKFYDYDSATDHIKTVLAAYHPDQKKIEDYGSE